MAVINWFNRIVPPQNVKNAVPAYDLWAAGYDDQPNNLMLALDEEIFNSLLSEITLSRKVIVDIGCGTGRHWKKILFHTPARIIGYDVSKQMLNRLMQKYPGAETHIIKNSRMPELADQSGDIVISTLTMAHIDDLEDAMEEWNRILKPGGYMLLTDYHPESLAKGAQRTFEHNGKTIAIRNNIHSINKVNKLAGQLGLKTIRFSEKIVDESLKKFYVEQNALAIFERFQNVPIIYGMLLKKTDDPL
jgi:ubiquinone/menaquinone biosynthesis C-methylase UbiE